MRENKWLKNLLVTVIIIVGSLYISLSTGIKVQAEGITSPTPINQLFPDPALAELMKDALGKMSVTEEVTQRELDTVKRVNGTQLGIKTIEGIQFLNELIALILTRNEIMDIKPLANLKKLEKLSLAVNRVIDVRSLAELKNLKTLYLFGQVYRNTPLEFQEHITIPNTVRKLSGRLIKPYFISGNGVYMKPNLVWDLSGYLNEVSYSFNYLVKIGEAEANFSGKVIQPLGDYDVIEYNKVHRAIGRIKPGSKHDIWSHPYKTQGSKIVGNICNFIGEDLRIIREVKTTSDTFYQFSVAGDKIGWVEASALTVLYRGPKGELSENKEAENVCGKTRISNLVNTRRIQFEQILKNGFPDGKKLNQHAFNSLFKSGRKSITFKEILGALINTPNPAKEGSVEYINTITGTSVFVNPDKNEVVGIWPACFKKKYGGKSTIRVKAKLHETITSENS
ncbi:GW domain-containing glycosaminoglycan-binding protein [Listeria seeligeri]|uniref:GW domain-containing glycosaminoglycan-binding protein n=1 Tax=Listeria seeligeri TaxID=1640 RepID=UPI00188805A2|nr:GW domain-containing glycosaminoglycan-binding protein [Listeria seeligeri]MBF2481877.1 GW domain-containing glycosaminoglycan-binding protein [Listeria seeligeri]MBF2599828.1 GW domain-containing glycosaminoglycan-binding protein [Listeria seeligeri]